MLNERFVDSDILTELEKALDAFDMLPSGIQSYTLCEYLLQSIFLQMSGHQEQKCKVMLWNIASVDLDCRYEILSGKLSINEASKFEDKEKVYKQLIKSSAYLGLPIASLDEKKKEEMIESVKNRLNDILTNSIVGEWIPREISEFLSFGESLKNHAAKYMDENGIFNGINIFIDAADMTWRHRNRCAHNLFSYQDNIPDFQERLNDKHNINNYPTRFFTLALIDNALRVRYNYFIKHAK